MFGNNENQGIGGIQINTGGQGGQGGQGGIDFGSSTPTNPTTGVISLSKGEKIDLGKAAPGLKEALIGLGWTAQSRDGAEFDLDASAFLLDENDKAHKLENFIFYNNLTGANGCCEHMGDELTGGDGSKDDEQIIIKFDKVPANIQKIGVAVTIFEAESRRQNFGQVRKAYVRVADNLTGEEKVRFDLGEDFSTETAVVVAEFYKHNGGWRMSAVGSGYAGGLRALASGYGLRV